MEFVLPSDLEIESVQILKARIAEASNGHLIAGSTKEGSEPENSISIPEGNTYIFTDTAALRFLRGRKHDLDKTFRAMVRHLNWRKQNGADEMTDERIQLIQGELTSGKIHTIGFDKSRRPCLVITARYHNKNNRDLDIIQTLIIHTLESVLRQSRPEEERMVIVFDLSNFNMQCMDYDAVKILVDIVQFNYPETLHVAYIVNAPMLFSACWFIIKAWIDPVTVSKVVFTETRNLSSYLDEQAVEYVRVNGSGTPAIAIATIATPSNSEKSK